MATPQKLRCRVDDVIAHGGKVYTIVMSRQQSAIPRFKPGQFLHLALDDYDPAGFWPESRVFSIMSAAGERDRISITYSVKGSFTTRMDKEIVIGRLIWIKMPYGEFVIDANRPVVLFAGGTGITALAAFLDGMVKETNSRVTLFYGARERQLLVYRSLVERCRQSLTGFHAYYFIERDLKLLENELAGPVSVSAAWQFIPDPLRNNYYLSGPPEMLVALSTQLQRIGVMAGNIHSDAWE